MGYSGGVFAAGYRLLEQLGLGGTAAVWRAVDAQGATHAVKLLRPVIVGAPRGDGSALVLREVEAAGRLRHRNIVAVHDTGSLTSEVAGHPAGSPFLAMELADGGSLENVAVMPWPTLKQVASSVLAGLAHAHARGFLHLDVKPANVVRFLRPTTVKLTDFGIARSWVRAQDRAGAIEGTLAYMAPEQLRGEHHLLGPWTDLFAVGAMVFRLASGQLPFPGPVMAVMAQHERRVVPVTTALTPAQNAWLARLLAFEPGDRFHLAAAAAAALDALDDSSDDVDNGAHGGNRVAGAGLALPVVSATAATVLHAESDATVSDATLAMPPDGSSGGLHAPTLFDERSVEAAYVDLAKDALVDHLACDPHSAVLVRGDDVAVARVMRHSRQALQERGLCWSVVIPADDAAPVQHALSDFIGIADAKPDEIASRLQAMGFPLSGAALAAVDVALRPLSSDAERRLALITALLALRKHARLVVYVDDAANNVAALDLAADLLAVPALQVVVGLGDGDGVISSRLDNRATAARLRLLQKPIELDVDQFADEGLIEALQTSMHLSARATQLVADFANGSPDAVIDLLRDGRRRGWLVEEDGVTGIVGDRDYDVETCCAERVAAALAPWTKSEAVALERAAVWGLAINEDEWRASLPDAEPRRLSDLLQQLDAQGLLRWTPTSTPPRLRFLHPSFRAVLLRLADQHGRRAAHHRACALALGTGVRAARHLLAAGDNAAARALWRNALHDALVAGDEHLGRQTKDEIAAAGLGDDDDDVYDAWIDALERRPAAAREKLARVPATAAAATRALAGLVGGMVDAAEGKFAESSTTLRAVVPLLPPFLAEHARYRAADALYYAGRHEQAEDAYARLGASTEDRSMRIRCGFAEAYVKMVRGDKDGAKKGLLDVERQARAGGSTLRDLIQIENALGELARESGDLKDAEARYRRVLLHLRSVGDASLAIGLGNLTITLIDRGADDEARHVAEEILTLLEGAEVRSLLAGPLLFAAVALIDVQPTRAAAVLRRAAAAAGDVTELDFANGYDRAARRALLAGEIELAVEMSKLAIHQWRALERPAAAAALVELFSVLP